MSTLPSLETDLELVGIAAVAENGVIGDNGEIPWHYPADLRHYKQTTIGHPIIMGRGTYESLGDPLSGRTNIVLTTRGLDAPEEVVVVSSIEDAIEAAHETGVDTAYIIGGESVYEAFLPHLDQLLITEIPETYDGDTYFPNWDDNEWTELSRTALTDELDIVTYLP